MTFSCHILSGFCWLWQFLGFSCFGCPWWSESTHIRYFVGCPSPGTCLIFFSWLDWGCGFWREKPKRQNPILTIPPQGYILSTWFGLSWVPEPKWGLSGFSTVQLTFPLLYVLFGRKSFEVHTYRVESYGFSSSLGLLEYLHNLFSVILLGDLSLLSHSCVLVWTHKYTLVINQYYWDVLRCSNCSSFGLREHFQRPLWHTCISVLLLFLWFLSTSLVLTLQDTTDFWGIFPASLLKLAISPGSFGSF